MRSFIPLAFVLMLLCGCSKEAVEQADFSEPVLSRQYRQGSVTVVVSVSATNMVSSGKAQLMIDVHAPPDNEVLFPEIGHFIDPFSVADGYSEPVQTLPNGKHLYRRVWILVPSLPGETAFLPIEIASGATVIKTDPIRMRVGSLLPEELDTFEIKDIAEPVALLPEEERKRRLWLTLTGAGLVILFLTAVIKKIRQPKIVYIAPPHEAALAAMENLPADPVARVHELNRILRSYIEARHNLPAIGKTTTELIPVFEEIGPETLVDFLQTCEQMRFSNIVPETLAGKAETIVREFIESSMQEEPCD